MMIVVNYWISVAISSFGTEIFAREHHLGLAQQLHLLLVDLHQPPHRGEEGCLGSIGHVRLGQQHLNV